MLGLIKVNRLLRLSTLKEKICIRHAGVTKVAHDAGTTFAEMFAPCGTGVKTDGTPPVSTGKLQKNQRQLEDNVNIEETHAVVGCMNSMWLVSTVGIEKERVRMDWSPVAW